MKRVEKWVWANRHALATAAIAAYTALHRAGIL